MLHGTCGAVGVSEAPPSLAIMEVTSTKMEVYGILLACLSAALNATGVNLQRLGKRRESAAMQLFGVLVGAGCCPICDLASFTFAPQSMLAPFASLGLVVNLGLAPIMHGDPIDRLDIACTGLVIAGVLTCLCSASAADAEATLTLEELMALALRPALRLWSTITATVVGLAAVHMRRGDQHSMLAAASFAVFSGICGGLTMLCGKVLTVLGAIGAGGAPFAFVAGCACVLGISQVASMNAGLGRHSPLVVVPIFTAASLTTNAIGGGILFNEFAAFSRAQWVAYPSGVALLLSGVVLLTLKPPALRSSLPPKKRED